jgi:transcription antitermination factor NusA-like protein
MSFNISIPIGLGAFCFGGLVVFWIINNPDKVERIVSWLVRLFSLIPIARQHLAHLRLATSLQTTINVASESLNSRAFRLLPHTMKIEWTKTGEDAQTFLRDGQVIVRMHPNIDDDHNIVVSTMAYLKKGLIPQARYYVDKTLMQATDYAVAKAIFKSAKRDSASEFFIQNILLPETTKNPQLTNDSTALDKISDAGFLSRIFLVQLHSLGRKLFPATPTIRVEREIRNFFEFLQDIALKKSEEIVNLDFAHSNIRVKVMLVAREETKQRGTQDFIRRIKQAQSDGLDYIYITGWGKENIRFIETIAQSQQKTGRLAILSRYPYERAFSHGGKTPAICIVAALNITKAGQDVLDLPGTLYALLEEHIDELRDGQIEVTGLARKPGILSKVIVKSRIDGLDPVPCFTRKLGGGSLQIALGRENLHVIHWCETIEGLISSALLPFDTDCISSIQLDHKTRTASVELQPDKYSKAIGRNGVNVQLTSKLTGWHINLKRTVEE